MHALKGTDVHIQRSKRARVRFYKHVPLRVVSLIFLGVHRLGTQMRANNMKYIRDPTAHLM